MKPLNEKLALLLWATDESGKDEVAVYSGLLIKIGDCYYFKREGHASPEIREEWLSRIKKVPNDLRDTLY